MVASKHRMVFVVSVLLASGFGGEANAKVPVFELATTPKQNEVGTSKFWDQPDPSFDELEALYEDVTNGLIRPRYSNPPADLSAQDYFKLDVAGFTEFMRRPSFLEAKFDFYSRLNFSEKRQRHDNPYYFMNSWGLNFHPPVKELEHPLEFYVPMFSPSDPAQQASLYFDPDFQLKIDRMSKTEMTYGNQLELLPNSKSYQARLRLLKDAKESFFGVVMFYMCDDTGTEFVNEMIKKVREGVDVRLISEGLYGSTINGKCIKRMRDNGIDVVLTADFYKPKYFLAVMHHKFWIKDGEEAVAGGQNMHDYSNESDGFNLTRDTDVYVKGPAVTDLMREYIRLWNRYKMKKHKSMDEYESKVVLRERKERWDGVRGSEFYSRWLGHPDTRMNGVCRFLAQTVGAEDQAIAPVVAELSKAAEEHIVLTSPSVRFNPKKKRSKAKMWEDKLAWVLRDRADAGVQIDFLSNGLPGGMGDASNFVDEFMQKNGIQDKNLASKFLTAIGHMWAVGGAKSTRDNFKILLKHPNFRGYQYMEFMHQKIWYFDRIMAMISSFNLDRNSAERNHEEALFCMDRTLRNQLEHQFALDMINSVPVTSKNGQ